jgi:hypothetical protein
LEFMKRYVDELGPLLINSMNWFKV